MEPNTTQVLCTGDCGFYGSADTDGLCSVCYKKKPRQSPAVSATPVTSAQNSPTVTARFTPELPKKDEESATGEACASGEKLENSFDGKEADKDSGNLESSSDGKEAEKDAKKKPKNRCNKCRKKVGLTGFGCRCGGLFCSTHRYSDKHDCQFDYREMAAQDIRSKNPVVVGEKVQKI